MNPLFIFFSDQSKQCCVYQTSYACVLQISHFVYVSLIYGVIGIHLNNPKQIMLVFFKQAILYFQFP